jgi:hypothetical protein
VTPNCALTGSTDFCVWRHINIYLYLYVQFSTTTSTELLKKGEFYRLVGATMRYKFKLRNEK